MQWTIHKVMRLTVISDSYYGEWRDRLQLPTTWEEDEACLFLEAQGQKFLVDYGYENAVKKAMEYPQFVNRGHA